MAAYKENPELEDFFKVISLSIDKSGVRGACVECEGRVHT